MYEGHHIPISQVKWVDSVKVVGHSKNYLEIELKLYFSDDQYFSGVVRAAVNIDEL